MSFVLGGIFLFPSNEAWAAGCCQILTSTGSTCEDMDIIDYCSCSKIAEKNGFDDCKGVEYAAKASCNTTKKVCEVPKGSGSSDSTKSSESSSTSKPSIPTAKPASTPSSAAPKSVVPGGPTNAGNPKGTPKTGWSKFLPECATDEGQGPGHGCRDVGAFVSLFVNYANFTFGGIGMIAFLFLIYGGVLLLISAGSPEMVKKGRDAIIGAVIGILIVFSAQLLVRFVIQGMVPTENQDPVNKLQVKLPDTTEKK